MKKVLVKGLCGNCKISDCIKVNDNSIEITNEICENCDAFFVKPVTIPTIPIIKELAPVISSNYPCKSCSNRVCTVYGQTCQNCMCIMCKKKPKKEYCDICSTCRYYESLHESNVAHKLFSHCCSYCLKSAKETQVQVQKEIESVIIEVDTTPKDIEAHQNETQKKTGLSRYFWW